MRWDKDARMKGRLREVTSALKHKRNQRDDKSKSEGSGRQKLKHEDGDFPLCMRRESGDNEIKIFEKRRSESRFKFRKVDGDVPLTEYAKLS